MTKNHQHNHNHRLLDIDRSRLRWAFLITFGMMIAEFIGGYISKSIALTSDAVHMSVDAFALGIAFWAASISHKNQRIEIYAALINGIVLVLMSLFIFKFSLNRFICPREIDCQLMIIVAIVGLLVNLTLVFILRPGNRRNINFRAAFWHVISDALASFAVICGGIIILVTKWQQIDAILGLVIALVVLRFGLSLIKDSIKLLKRG